VYLDLFARASDAPYIDTGVIYHVVDNSEPSAFVERNDWWRYRERKLGAIIPKWILRDNIKKATNLLLVVAFEGL
jgi:hypothetical protein